MTSESFAGLIRYSVPSLILVAGSIDDLRSRKVHNWLVVTCAIVAIIYAFYNNGLSGIGHGLLGMLVAVAVFLPLVVFKILGAGDLKLMMAFALATNYEIVLVVAMYSLVWAAVFGLFRVILSGQLSKFITNMKLILLRQPVESERLSRIPYTIALFLGWLSFLTLSNGGAT